MKTIKKTKTFAAGPEEVFGLLDDLGVTGMHMTESSMPMMGGKMNIEFLSENKSGLNTRYRWTGKVLWMVMDFTVVVTKWTRGQQKSWETQPGARMIIMSWFKMDLLTEGNNLQTTAHLSISYQRPKGVFQRILSFVLADWYCKWCLNNMLNDTQKKLSEKTLMLAKSTGKVENNK